MPEAGASSSGSYFLRLTMRVRRVAARTGSQSQAGGEIRSSIDLGAPAKAGTLPAEIDAPEVDEQLRQARAGLVTAQANSGSALWIERLAIIFDGSKYRD